MINILISAKLSELAIALTLLSMNLATAIPAREFIIENTQEVAFIAPDVSFSEKNEEMPQKGELSPKNTNVGETKEAIKALILQKAEEYGVDVG